MLCLSIIIPVINEAGSITQTLQNLQSLRQRGHEIIICDGGSTDATINSAQPLSDSVVQSAKGRACQMNTGAAIAQGDVLLFVHADTYLPNNADTLISQSLQDKGHDWGRFDVRLSGSHPLLRMIERMMNWRSCLTGIATGDQCIFVRRDLFNQLHGFPNIPLMEDIALCKKLKHHGRPACLKQTVITSSRRWEQKGILRTILLMWRLRIFFYLGKDPQRLGRLYYDA